MRIVLLLLGFVLLTACAQTPLAVVDNPINATIASPLTSTGTALIVEDYNYAVASGDTNSATVWNKFGYNNDIDVTTSPELIAEFGGDNSFILDAAETLNISSTSALDVNGGTGAHGLVIYGVDENWVDIIDVVFLNGTNTVQSNLQFRGVNRASLFRAGSTFENQGLITLTAADAGSTQAEIPQYAGTTEQAVLFVSANHTFLADYIFINANKLAGGSSPKIEIDGWVRSYVSNAEYDVFEMTIDTAVENTVQLAPMQPFIIGEKSVFYWMATTDTNNALVTLRFSGILKENN